MKKLKELAEQFFNKSDVLSSDLFRELKRSTIGSSLIDLNDPASLKVEFALIGVEDDTNTNNKGCSKAPDEIRKYLFKLFNPLNKARIIDLGNLKQGNSNADLYYAIKMVVSELVQNNIKPIIIGGGNDLVLGQFLAYQDFDYSVNITTVDSKFDLGLSDNVNAENYISKIISDHSKQLFNYSNLGYQKYLVSQADIDLMNRLFFDSYRLGEIRENIELIEPVLRDSDIVAFDISAVRQSDAPAYANCSPNGLYGEEACQIAWYAGNSSKVSSFGIYEVNPDLDNNNQTAHLAAQIVWHYLDGACNLRIKHNVEKLNEYDRYLVDVDVLEHKITFIHSQEANLWWMEVPYPEGIEENTVLIACSKEDYHKATRGDVPDRLWRTYQKIS